MSQFLDDLRWRGLIAQTTDEKELAAALEKPITLYIGFDPTAPSKSPSRRGRCSR